MRSVGIRELRQRASELVRHVEAGDSFEVTDRGRPVAVLAPIAATSTLARMRALGETSGQSKGLTGLGKPLVVAGGPRVASRSLAALRKNER
jgi:prevent-host-death family protein